MQVYLSNVPKFTLTFKDQLKNKKKINEKVQQLKLVDMNESVMSEFESGLSDTTSISSH